MFSVMQCCCTPGGKEDVESTVAETPRDGRTAFDPDNKLPAAAQLSRDRLPKPSPRWNNVDGHGAQDHYGTLPKPIVTGAPVAVDLGSFRNNNGAAEGPGVIPQWPTSPGVSRELGHPARSPRWGPTSTTFEVTLVKHSGETFGLDLNPHDGVTPLIGQVKHGLIEDWNMQQGETAVSLVSRGDRIVAVNGVRGDSVSLLEALQIRCDREVFTITVSRLMEFRVTWSRSFSQNLALDFAPTKAEAAVQFVLVKQVHPGPVQEANSEVGPELECRCGDRILEVNGIEGDEMLMLKILAQESSLMVRLRRPPLAVLSA